MEWLVTSSGLCPSDAGYDVFRWHPIESDTFSVDSMYNTLVKPNVPVDHNQKI
jgi:hypothetical protein